MALLIAARLLRLLSCFEDSRLNSVRFPFYTRKLF